MIAFSKLVTKKSEKLHFLPARWPGEKEPQEKKATQGRTLPIRKVATKRYTQKTDREMPAYHIQHSIEEAEPIWANS